jgi:transposase
LQAARQRQQTQEFKDQYALRSGVEGSISHAAFTLGLRRTRYRGVVNTHLQHLATAAAINLIRVTHWLADVPRSQTRKSRFAALVA